MYGSPWLKLVLHAMRTVKCELHTDTSIQQMILSLTCHSRSICSLQPQNQTRCVFRSRSRSTYRSQTHSKPSWTLGLRFANTLSDPQSTAKRSSAASAVATDTMPDTQQDLLFAAAMPKEEIGALEFLKVPQTSLTFGYAHGVDQPYDSGQSFAATTTKRWPGSDRSHI